MAIPLLDLDKLAKACRKGDLSVFASTAQLGWTLTEEGRLALLRVLADTNFHRWHSFGASAFTVAQAIGLVSEAANNAAGIAITEQVRARRVGKEVAIAFRHAGQVHFGIRYASNLPMTPGHLWPTLKPWFKSLERNRARLEQWVASAEGIISVPLRASPASEACSGEKLLAAVVADPDNVAARLVYADWLLARGDAQGELIQLCEQQRSGGDGPSLAAAIEHLHEDYGERIAGEVAHLATDYTLARGFVTRIQISAPNFAKHGERLLDRHPIEELELKPVNAQALARLARVPALARIRTLNLAQLIDRQRPMPLNELCSSPHLEALRRLELWLWQTDGDPAQAFASLRAPRLESLLLFDVDSAPQILIGLTQNQHVQLRGLEIGWRERNDWPAVLAAPAFDRLQHLRFAVEGESAGHLFEHARLPELVSLELGSRFPIARLCCPTLRRLRLAGPIDAHGFAGLLERHPQLRRLNVRTMDLADVEQALETALGLPSDHTLESLALPMISAEPQLVARARARFGAKADTDD